MASRLTTPHWPTNKRTHSKNLRESLGVSLNDLYNEPYSAEFKGRGAFLRVVQVAINWRYDLVEEHAEPHGVLVTSATIPYSSLS